MTMNEVQHEPEGANAMNVTSKSADPVCVEMEMQETRPRRKPTRRRKVGTEPDPQPSRALEEVSWTTTGPRQAAIPVLRQFCRQAIACALRVWCWLRTRQEWQLKSKRLRLCEIVSLGEKRFLAIVQVDRQRFLVGGAQSTVSMLTQLNDPDDFAAVLQPRHRRGRTGA